MTTDILHTASILPANYYFVDMATRSKALKILALAPGKRKFGLAVFTGIELTYFALKSFRKVRSERLLIDEVVILIRELIDRFGPGVIAIRAISKYQQTSSILKQMCIVLKRETAIKQIPFVEVTLNQIVSTLGKNQKATKKDAIRSLAHIYPELMQFMDRPSQWQNQYYNNLFMAVSVGVVRVNTQNQKTSRSNSRNDR